MRIYVALIVVAGFLVIGNSIAQGPATRCPASSSVSALLSELELEVIVRTVQLSDEWRKRLKAAAHSDVMACLAVENAMWDRVDQISRLRDETLRLRDEIDRLIMENKLLKMKR